MKQTKLLTSLVALTLVLSLGACSSKETLPDPSEVVVTSPVELIEKASTYGNYSLEIELDLYTSINTITYEEYLAAYAYIYGYGNDYEAYLKYYDLCYSEVYYDYSYLWDVFYDTDYLYADAYLY